MIGDTNRGFAFTKAVLGLGAKEIHLCGDASANSLIEEICQLTGDNLIMNSYQRLSGPLVFDSPLQSLKEIQKGDCIIAFSRKEIFKLKKLIEVSTGLKTCVIYGNLPPETRKSQALLFNDPFSEYDVLVASDAVGMGLNLNIRRIIFHQLKKYDGIQRRTLSVSEILQVAGRAGRYSFDHSQGLVTCLSSCPSPDILWLQQALSMKPKLLEQAGLRPGLEMLENLSERFPSLPFSALISLAEKSATLDGEYFMCDLKDMKLVSALIDEYYFLSLQTRSKIYFLPPLSLSLV